MSIIKNKMLQKHLKNTQNTIFTGVCLQPMLWERAQGFLTIETSGIRLFTDLSLCYCRLTARLKSPQSSGCLIHKNITWFLKFYAQLYVSFPFHLLRAMFCFGLRTFFYFKVTSMQLAFCTHYNWASSIFVIFFLLLLLMAILQHFVGACCTQLKRRVHTLYHSKKNLNCEGISDQSGNDGIASLSLEAGLQATFDVRHKSPNKSDISLPRGVPVPWLPFKSAAEATILYPSVHVFYLYF